MLCRSIACGHNVPEGADFCAECTSLTKVGQESLLRPIELNAEETAADLAIAQINAVAAAEFTGSNVNYYLVDIPDPKRLDPYQAECEDIIEALGMTFAEGCAFKAIWRSCAARQGKQKKGMDDNGVYDAQKVVYYGERMLAQRQRQNNQ